MIVKYTFRLIKSTFNRFIAILAIVFIGVSFMMGLRSNYDIMKNSVEHYLDDKNLYDIQIYSGCGFDDKDVRAIKNQDYVKNVFASKTRDTYAKDEAGNELVSRVLEIDSSLNNIELEEGRMPEKENECLIISGFRSGKLEIGNEISLFFKDDEIKDTLKNDKFTIVGIAKSPEYMSQTFTTSLLNNKVLSCVLYIPNDNFISEYYTCLYIELNASKGLNSFSKEYETFVDEKVEMIEDFSKYQSKELKNKIIEEATTKLEDAKKELKEEKEKYQKEFDDAKKKLDDAKKLLETSKKEIEDSEKKIIDSEIQLKDGQDQVNAGYEEIVAQEKVLNDAKAQFEEYGISIEQIEPLVNGINGVYNTSKQGIEELEKEKEDLLKQKQESKNIVNNSAYKNMSAREVRRILNTTNPRSDKYQELLRVYEALSFLETCDLKISSVNIRLNVFKPLFNGIEDVVESQLGIDSVEDTLSMLVDGLAQIKKGEVLIKEGYAKLEEAQKQINEGKVELEKGKVELANGKVQFEKGLKDYNEGLDEYNDGVKEFEKQIRDAQDKIDDGEKQLADLKDAKWTVLRRYDTNYSFYMYKNSCEQMKSIGDIIPLLFFIVAALVCSTTMTRLIDEQRGQIGIYCALGFRKNEIISIYLLYVTLASLLASIVAIGAGILIFPTIIYNTWRLMYDLPSIILSIPIRHVLICVSCFTLLMIVVTLIVVSNSLKECSAQLLRPKAPKSTKQIVLEKWTWLWSKLPFASKVTARNILRYKGRFIMTIIGVAGCTSLLVLGFGIKDSVGSVVSLQYEQINKFNYVVDIKNDRHIDEILKDIKEDKNNEVFVEHEQYTSKTTIADKDLTINVYVVDKDRVSDIFGIYDYKTGKQSPLTDTGVLVSNRFCKDNNLRVGDKLTLESLNGINGEFVVEGIVTNYVGNIVYVSQNNYKNTFNEDIEYTTIGVINNGDVTKLLDLQNKHNDINTVNDLSGEVVAFNDMIEALNLIIALIILVAGALAFVVLINLTNVNISERIREIATLKVLGFREHEVDSYIFKEVLLMSIVGAIIGLPLGNIEERFVMTVIDIEICSFPHIIFPISYLYAFVITIIFTGIVLLLTRRTLRKVKMVESLKSIE